MTRIPIMLDEKDILALSRLAKYEHRDIRQQAAILVRDELARRGMFSQAEPIDPAHAILGKSIEAQNANKLTK